MRKYSRSSDRSIEGQGKASSWLDGGAGSTSGLAESEDGAAVVGSAGQWSARGKCMEVGPLPSTRNAALRSTGMMDLPMWN